jgi:hypothetical protein
MEEANPQEFVNSAKFMDNLEGWRKKRLERLLVGGLFVSHSSLDFPQRIFSDPENVIVKIWEIIIDRFGPDGWFLHNIKSGGAEAYRELVNIALTHCDKFLLLVSARSVRSPWVRAEVQFALVNQRPVIEAYLDDTDIMKLYDALPAHLLRNHHSGRYGVNFNEDIEQGRAALAELLDQLLAQLPYPRVQ